MSYWKEKLKIGNLTFPRFVGGPLDGVTDSPFRKVVREFSKDELLYTEMRHVACVANDKGGAKALAFEQIERPLNYQLTANGVEFIERACEKVLASGVDIVDLNIGCPAKNVVGSGSGSALMADLPLLEKVLKLFRKSLGDTPFTVKMRAGFKNKNALEVAKLAQDCGANGIAIHPRSQTEKFSGVPDYALAAQVKQSVSIPVLFSGGVVDFESAKFVYEQTGVDGFLIGRGIWAQAWKLKELYEHSLGNSFNVDNKLKLSCALSQLDNMLEYYGDKGLYCFRKHVPFYIKDLPSASEVRAQLVTTESVDEVKKGLLRFLG
ncbi:tRNA-dihydrouridine synthase [bacterium]|nr:tRNA-dihydrouridine synthase [bacterium]